MDHGILSGIRTNVINRRPQFSAAPMTLLYQRPGCGPLLPLAIQVSSRAGDRAGAGRGLTKWLADTQGCLSSLASPIAQPDPWARQPHLSAQRRQVGLAAGQDVGAQCRVLHPRGPHTPVTGTPGGRGLHPGYAAPAASLPPTLQGQWPSKTTQTVPQACMSLHLGLPFGVLCRLSPRGPVLSG